MLVKKGWRHCSKCSVCAQQIVAGLWRKGVLGFLYLSTLCWAWRSLAHRNEGKGNWISFHQHRLNKNEHFKEVESSAYVLTGDGKVVQEDFLKVPLAVLPFLSCLFSFVLTKCWSCTDVWRAPCNIRYTWHTVGSFNALFGRAGGHVLLPCRVTRLCSQGSRCAWIWGWTDGSGWDVSWACLMASTALSSSQVNFAVFCFISPENSLFWEKQLYP